MPIVAITGPAPVSGRSTTAVALARQFTQYGARVLLIDLAADADATAALFPSHSEPAPAIRPAAVPGLDVASGSLDPLSDVDSYGYVLLDLPAWGPVTRDALTRVDAVIVTVAAEEGWERQLPVYLAEIERIRQESNPRLRVSILRTMADAAPAANAIRTRYPADTLDTVIPTDGALAVVLDDANVLSRPSRGSEAYSHLAGELGFRLTQSAR